MAAKDFLVSRIMKEAERESVNVSDVERKMLYYSEGFDTLPDMSDVSDEFDTAANTSQYERKISKLIRNAFKHDRKESPELIFQWRRAIQLLGREDHYVFVMLGKSGVREHIPGLRWKEWAWALAFVAAGFAYVFLRAWFLRLGDRLSPRGRLVGWVIIIAVLILLYRTGPQIVDYFVERKRRKKRA